MFQRFTARAREVVVLAQDEARLLRQNYIGTEHILLGLLREEEGLAARVLRSLDVSAAEVRARVAQIVGQGDELASGEIPFTPRAKKVLELALREANALGHNYIGTEHILLGLARQADGVAARILLDFHAPADKIRDAVIGLLSGGAVEEPARADPQLVAELEEVALQKEAAIDMGEFKRAARLRDKELRLRRSLHAPPEVEEEGASVELGARVRIGDGFALGRGLPRGMTDYASVVVRVPLLAGWLLFGVALGIGIFVGWLIWG